MRIQQIPIARQHFHLSGLINSCITGLEDDELAPAGSGKNQVSTIKQSGPIKRPFNTNVLVNLDWQASWMYEFGVTRYFENGWHVSGGYVFNQNSVPDTYYSPLVSDLNRNFFSLGTGFNGKRFNFDIAYQLGFAFKRDVTGSKPPVNAISGSNGGHPADGTYSFSSSAIIATVGINF